MNNITSSLHVSFLLLVGVTLFLGACGPEFDDPTLFSEKTTVEAKAGASMDDEINAPSAGHIAVESRPEAQALPPVATPPASVQTPYAFPINNNWGIPPGLEVGMPRGCGPELSGGLWRYCDSRFVR